LLPGGKEAQKESRVRQRSPTTEKASETKRETREEVTWRWEKLDLNNGANDKKQNNS